MMSKVWRKLLIVLTAVILVLTLYKLPYSAYQLTEWEAYSAGAVSNTSDLNIVSTTSSSSDPSLNALPANAHVGELQGITIGSMLPTISPSATGDISASVETHAVGTQEINILDEDKALSFCQRYSVEIHPVRASRKVYDLFLVGTELDWLEIRLNTLAPYVDYFVIVESSKTFTYNDKPLLFKENSHRFASFLPQILYRVVNSTGMEDWTTWEREINQRNALLTDVFPNLVGHQAANEDDVIIVSDLDEIPKEDTILALRNCRFPDHITIHSNFFYYSFQWQHNGNQGQWAHPQATLFRGTHTILPHDLRYASSYGSQLRNASWHCSSCFSTVTQLQNKIESFSHSEFDLPIFKDPWQIVRRVRNGLDLFDREGETYNRVDNNEDLPTYLKDNKDQYPWMLNRDPPNANFVDFEGEGAKSIDEFEVGG